MARIGRTRAKSPSPDGKKLFFGPPAGTGDGGATPAVEVPSDAHVGSSCSRYRARVVPRLSRPPEEELVPRACPTANQI